MVHLNAYDKLPLECDGLTRVLSYVLKAAGEPFQAYGGRVVLNGEEFPVHYWIILGDGLVVDYRLRMWFGETAPHGVFRLGDHPGLEYFGEPVDLACPAAVFDYLTRSLEL